MGYLEDVLAASAAAQGIMPAQMSNAPSPAAPVDPFAAGAANVGLVPADSGGRVYNDFDPRTITGVSLATPPAVLPGGQPVPTSAPPVPPPPQAAAAPMQQDAAPVPQPFAAERPPISIASGGGTMPEHERSLLGPTQWAALESSNRARESAIQGMEANTAAQQQSDEAVYLAHARDARLREDAANSASLERDEELTRRAGDFDRMAKTLAQERIDPDRFWASRSTPQKIAAFISIGLGGFVQGARGGSNVGLDLVNTAVERDIRAQEFAYKAKRDSLEAKNTAFGMAMHRYNSVDAARSFARVAAMDAVAAEISRQQAKGKGTESANRALAALAELQDLRSQQIVKGVQFVPAQYAAPKYRIAGRFGTYTEQEIKSLAAAEEGRGHELQKIGFKELVESAMKQRTQGAEEAKSISAQLAKEGVPKGRAGAESAREALTNAPISQAERLAPGIPGLGLLSTNPVVHKALFGKSAAEREQAWLGFKNDALHTLSGAAISPTEMPRLNRQFEGANDTASRLKAIQDYERALDEAERNALAGASPEGQTQYMRNKAAARTGGPTPLSGIKSFQPSGGK